MHTALEAAKQKLEARIQDRGGVPNSYTPPNLKHRRMAELRMPIGVNENGQRFNLLLRVCPECMSGYVFDITTAVDESIKAITTTQWRTQIKPFKTNCSERGDNG